MTLFKKSKKHLPKEEEKSNVTIFRTYTFTAQKGYRGFKRVHISSYPMKEYMSAIDTLVAKYSSGFSGLRVNLNVVQIQNGINKYNAIQVIVDGLIVGTIWEDNQYYEVICDGSVSEVYIKNEQNIVVGNDGAETRNKMVLLIKISSDEVNK